MLLLHVKFYWPCILPASALESSIHIIARLQHPFNTCFPGLHNKGASFSLEIGGCLQVCCWCTCLCEAGTLERVQDSISLAGGDQYLRAAYLFVQFGAVVSLQQPRAECQYPGGWRPGSRHLRPTLMEVHTPLFCAHDLAIETEDSVLSDNDRMH